jgi:sulfate adenylyltransferase subunit 1 (EFTu-like GTPase family)
MWLVCRPEGDLAMAVAGQAVTLTLSDDIDASRGDVISDGTSPAAVADRFATRLVWVGPDPQVPGRSYPIKLATTIGAATIETGLSVVDLETNRLNGCCVPDCERHRRSHDPYRSPQRGGPLRGLPRHR